MIAPIRIPQYNDVILVFPWYEQQILDEGPELLPLEIEVATDLSIQYSCNNGLTWKEIAATDYSVFGNRINVTIKAGTVHGYISFKISAKYRGQDISASWLKCVEFVKWNNTENYTEFLQGAPYLLPSNIAILTMPNVSSGTDEAIDFLMETKQDKEDAALETAAKTVVGAINELNNKKVDVDLSLDPDSENPIANKPVAEKFEEIEESIETSTTIEQEIKTNVACGALPAGSIINAGKTLTEVIMLLTSKVLLASRHTLPSATITSSISNNTTKEVGETIAPTLTAKFNDGKFNSYAAGAITTKTIDAGCDATAYQILRGGAVISDSASYTDSYKLPSGNTTYTCKITHSASASDIPTNSDGSVNTDVQFSSNTVTSGSITIKGAYKYFYGSDNSIPTDVRSLTNSFNRPSSVNMSGTKWFLYVPKTSTQPTSFKTALETYTIENETISNQDKKGVILKLEVMVKDAGGSDVAYYRYMMQLDNPLGSNINIA